MIDESNTEASDDIDEQVDQTEEATNEAVEEVNEPEQPDVLRPKSDRASAAPSHPVFRQWLRRPR